MPFGLFFVLAQQLKTTVLLSIPHVFLALHRGAFCHFLFRWIYYCHSSKSNGKETSKRHLCALGQSQDLIFLLPYRHHYNPLMIRNRSRKITTHKDRILRKMPLEKTFLNFKKWVKSIQTAGYNGARTVCYFQRYSWCEKIHFEESPKRYKLTSLKYIIHAQSHYIKIAQGAIFMEQKLRFGLDLGRLAILKKKIGPIMSNF
jgi:hypothetical protein